MSDPQSPEEYGRRFRAAIRFRGRDVVSPCLWSAAPDWWEGPPEFFGRDFQTVCCATCGRSGRLETGDQGVRAVFIARPKPPSWCSCVREDAAASRARSSGHLDPTPERLRRAVTRPTGAGRL
jgi:hypothetical protein